MVKKMKKCIALFLIFMLTLTACQIAPEAPETSNTDNRVITQPSVQGFVSPSDEMNATKSFSASNEGGLVMEITLHGYASESLGEEFYVKSNEYFRADVKLTNTSDQTYQQLIHACYGSIPPHNHEWEIDLKDENGHALVPSSFGFIHLDLLRPWHLAAGTAREWALYLAAGEKRLIDKEKDAEKLAEIDLPADGQNELPMIAAGIALYEEDIYTNHELDFSGTISFAYSVFSGSEIPNDRSLSCPISVKVMYVPFEK